MNGSLPAAQTAGRDWSISRALPIHWVVAAEPSGDLALARPPTRPSRSNQANLGDALPSPVVERRFDLVDGGLGDVATVSVLVVGVGRSGGRFVRAFNYLERIGFPVRVVALCDVNPVRLDTPSAVTAIFSDVRDALRTAEPDVVVVTVNEAAHFDVLMAISELAPKALVLSEKPLTETLAQFTHIERLFDSDAITVNFVEGYSPVVSDFHAWRQSESVEILRVEFYWVVS